MNWTEVDFFYIRAQVKIFSGFDIFILFYEKLM